MSRFLSKTKGTLSAYVPGEQPRDKKYIKLNTNESPFKPSKKAISCGKKALSRLQLYPDPEVKNLIFELSKTYGVKMDNVITANGSDEILNFIFLAFCDKENGVVFPDITYGFYPVFSKLNGVDYTEIPLNENFEINVDDYIGVNKNIFIANPNAPTGIALTLSQIELIVKSNPNNIVVIDEAYVDFGAQSAVCLTTKYDNLIIVGTFSKSRSMAGARLGFAIANTELILDLKTIKYSVNPYNVNATTYALGVGTLIDSEYTKRNCQKIIENREYTTRELKLLGFTVLNSSANFIFCKSDKVEGETLYKRLKEKGILVRYFSKERIKDFIRVTIGSKREMQTFILKVKEILENK